MDPSTWTTADHLTGLLKPLNKETFAYFLSSPDSWYGIFSRIVTRMYNKAPPEVQAKFQDLPTTAATLLNVAQSLAKTGNSGSDITQSQVKSFSPNIFVEAMAIWNNPECQPRQARNALKTKVCEFGQALYSHYLEKAFPGLDAIQRAEIVAPAVILNSALAKKCPFGLPLRAMVMTRIMSHIFEISEPLITKNRECPPMSVAQFMGYVSRAARASCVSLSAPTSVDQYDELNKFIEEVITDACEHAYSFMENSAVSTITALALRFDVSSSKDISSKTLVDQGVIFLPRSELKIILTKVHELYVKMIEMLGDASATFTPVLTGPHLATFVMLMTRLDLRKKSLEELVNAEFKDGAFSRAIEEESDPLYNCAPALIAEHVKDSLRQLVESLMETTPVVEADTVLMQVSGESIPVPVAEDEAASVAEAPAESEVQPHSPAPEAAANEEDVPEAAVDVELPEDNTPSRKRKREAEETADDQSAEVEKPASAGEPAAADEIEEDDVFFAEEPVAKRRKAKEPTKEPVASSKKQPSPPNKKIMITLPSFKSNHIEHQPDAMDVVVPPAAPVNLRALFVERAESMDSAKACRVYQDMSKIIIERMDLSDIPRVHAEISNLFLGKLDEFFQIEWLLQLVSTIISKTADPDAIMSISGTLNEMLMKRFAKISK